MWNEIEKAYSGSSRHYHNLKHIDTLAIQLYEYKDQFLAWDIIVFAIAYHDVVYNTLKKNNEEKSADFAIKRLGSLGVPQEFRDRCELLILATKNHEIGDDDTNLFVDADLSILGSDPETYTEYARQIRKEYSIYPDLIYNPGRKKVLQHFLDMKSIFKSEVFRSRFEEKARINLTAELQSI